MFFILVFYFRGKNKTSLCVLLVIFLVLIFGDLFLWSVCFLRVRFIYTHSRMNHIRKMKLFLTDFSTNV